ncbi:MAG: imidazoleglycerol-phosphate dehydratase, partial [Methanotrichaceae archaeon]|nr:imidazoleglycerol-phosphate dehydratase [Methanotrichaceae archaeon]
MKRFLKRETNETCVEVNLNLDGSGSAEVNTGVELLNEILCNLAGASGFDISIKARGDLETGDHHITEDVGITLGTILADLIQKGIGSSIVPSGQSLGLAAVSFGEPFFSGHFKFQAHRIGGLSLENISHFMRALAYNGQFTLHLKAEGSDDRRNIEAVTIALGRALKKAYQEEKEKL